LGLRDKIGSNQSVNAKELSKRIKTLSDRWEEIKKENIGKWIQVKNSKNNKTFFDELNELLGELSLANVT
jgi:hypothetical protein